MSLTMGTGPFGPRPWGTFDRGVSRPDRIAYVEPTPRRVRVEFAGQTVADSRHARLVCETGYLPSYYFPTGDVRTDLLEPSARVRRSPVLGLARSWSLRVGDRIADGAAFGWSDPPEGAPPVADLLTFDFDEMDAWYEENDQILGHPNDPYHRIDVRASDRHVRLSHRGIVLAESTRPWLLFETGGPPRYYLPAEDVRAELVPSDLHSRCPYKGLAFYWSLRAGGELLPDLAWSYPDPLPEAVRVAGALALFDERLDLDVDGERQPRYETPWSRAEVVRAGLRAPTRH
jgi:uncharacterized protein (DUF427 family)